MEVDSKGDLRGDFKQDMEGDLLSSSGQVRSRSGLVQVWSRSGPGLVQVWSRSGPGLVQVWFSLQPKFNSFELDSEVGRLILFIIQFF